MHCAVKIEKLWMNPNAICISATHRRQNQNHWTAVSIVVVVVVFFPLIYAYLKPYIPFTDSSAARSSQKKKKKDRERDREGDKDRDRDKEKSHRHKSHSSSKSSSTDSKATISASNGKIVSHVVSEHEINRLSANQSLHDKTNKSDKSEKCKSSSTSSSTKPTSSMNQSNEIELNGKHSMNENNSRKELNKSNSDLSTEDEVSQRTQQINSNEMQRNRLINTEELNNIPDTTTTDIEANSSSSSKMSPLPTPKPIAKSERKVFVPSNVSFTERKPTEAAGIVIKKDYLPPANKVIKVEKTRDDVTRVLNYDTEPSPLRNASTGMISGDSKSADDKIKIEKPETPIKTGPSDKKISDERQQQKSITNSHISENKENSVHKIESIKKPKEENSSSIKAKTEFKSRESSSEKKESKSLSRDSEHRHHSSSSSSKSSSKSSSHRTGGGGSGSGSNSSRDCSRCYRRSKIKKVNTGVQCCKYGEAFNTMTPTETPLKNTQTLACNIDKSIYSDLKYGRFFHIEVHTNGGASIVHMYQNEIDSLNEAEMEELTEEFFRVTFSEDEDGFAHHVMGIVHDAAKYIPDLLDHMADNYSNLTVKAGVLGRNSDIETSTLHQYYEQVVEKYSHGTFRYGPLHQISLVGKVHEEVGGYFPDLLGRLEDNPFLKKVG